MIFPTAASRERESSPLPQRPGSRDCPKKSAIRRRPMPKKAFRTAIDAHFGRSRCFKNPTSGPTRLHDYCSANDMRDSTGKALSESNPMAERGCLLRKYPPDGAGRGRLFRHKASWNIEADTGRRITPGSQFYHRLDCRGICRLSGSPMRHDPTA